MFNIVKISLVNKGEHYRDHYPALHVHHIASQYTESDLQTGVMTDKTYSFGQPYSECYFMLCSCILLHYFFTYCTAIRS